MRAMAKETALPVRLDRRTHHRLERAAKALGITKSALIRLLAESFVAQFVANHGRILMPPRWETGPTDKA